MKHCLMTMNMKVACGRCKICTACRNELCNNRQLVVQQTSKPVCYVSCVAPRAAIVLLVPLLATFTQGVLGGTIKPSSQVLSTFRKIASCPKWHHVEAGIIFEFGSCLTVWVFADPVYLCVLAMCSLLAHTGTARCVFACRLPSSKGSKRTRCNARPERGCHKWTALHSERTQRVQQSGAPVPAREDSTVPRIHLPSLVVPRCNKARVVSVFCALASASKLTRAD